MTLLLGLLQGCLGRLVKSPRGRLRNRIRVVAGYGVVAHASLTRNYRATTDSGFAIDLILGRGVRFAESGVGPRRVWGALSDHLPVWTRLGL